MGGGHPSGRSQQYAFAAASDPAGAHLLYSTLFGDLDSQCANGCGSAWGTGIAVDQNGYLHLIGDTRARVPTTTGVVQPTVAPLDPHGAYLLSFRGFVAKFNPVTSAGGPIAGSLYLPRRAHGSRERR